MNALDVLMLYVAVGGSSLLFYGFLIGIDHAEAKDFGVVFFLALTWPIFILPFLGVAIGLALKKRGILK